MDPGNRSSVTEFIMLGLTSYPKMGLLFYLLLMPVYIFTLLGNMSIMVIVWFSPNLHTPMYILLAQLAFIDIAFSSVISPNMLFDLLKERKVISMYGCITQMFFVTACASTEFILLAAMAYDRYVAVSNPLLYSASMTRSLCVQLVVWSYIGGFLHSLIHIGCLLRLHFCGPNVINHFICDIPFLLGLSCTDISVNELVRLIFAAIVVGGSLLVIFVSYFYIVRAIMRVGTTAERRRAASTCISHFTCVFLFYGSAFLVELQPHSGSGDEQYKKLALIPTVFVPALNPLIYTMRNNEVKDALRKILKKAGNSH